MRISALGLIVFFLAAFFSTIRAEQFSIKIVSSAQTGCWSLEEIVQSVIPGIESDREKALALHKFGMAHQIHFNGPKEGAGYLADALKILGVYGYSLCGNNSAAMCALYNLAGLEARRRFLTGHVVPEVRFDGRWNYIDTDMFGYVVKPDGNIASVDELLEKPALFERNSYNPEPFFPFDNMQTMQNALKDTEGKKDHHPYLSTHMMKLRLRTLESVTCYFRPQGRYYLSPYSLPENMGTRYRTYWLDGPVRGNSLAWTDTVPAAYGNAVFEYRPDLRSKTFILENPGSNSVKVQTGENFPELVAAAGGRMASLVVEITTPWVIAGRQNDLTDFEDNTDGALVRGWFWRAEQRDENRILVSPDGGISWKTIWENKKLGAVPFQVDFTPQVEGHYGYLVKFEWVDHSAVGKVGLEGLEFETWTELSPMALPHLSPGENTMYISNGKHRAFLCESRWKANRDLFEQKLENLMRIPESSLLVPVETAKPGVLIFSPLKNGLIDELRLGIEAHVLEGRKPQDISVVLFLSENKGGSWKQLAAFSAHPEHEQNWMLFNHIIQDRSFNGSDTRIKIEVTGGCLSKVVANSLVRKTPVVPSALRVSHAWKEGSGWRNRQTVSWVFQPGAENTSYTVSTPVESIINESLKIEAIAPESGE
jgi:hypothetical protein